MDLSNDLAPVVADAAARRQRLRITGSGSKAFYTGASEDEPLEVAGHRGIVEYEPTELVLTARTGTPLAEIESALAANGQMLAFEPPHFGPEATLGGTIACGFSGPRRPWAGSARDFVLGARILNGKGENLRFGGQVMKNVAGFDVSRLMVGSLGSLGVILDVSLKVLPRPEQELTLAFPMNAAEAIARMNALAGQPLPLSGACHHDGTLYVRLSGSAKGVAAARARLGGETLPTGNDFWLQLREQRLAFFAAHTTLWRLSVPAATPPLALAGNMLIDWSGAQRWLASDAPAAAIHTAVSAVGGWAVPFRNGPAAGSLFARLDPAVRALQRRIQQAFDPHGVFGGAVSFDSAA